MNLSGKTILMVDDDPITRRILREMLSDTSATLLESSNGKDAFAYVEERVVDIIISDVRMHSGSGTFLLGKVKKEFPETKVILISKFDDISEEIAQNEGALNLLHKPINKEQLFELLNNCLDSGTTVA